MKLIFSLFIVYIIQTIYGAPVDRPVITGDLRQTSNDAAVVVSENSSPRQPSVNKLVAHKVLTADDQHQQQHLSGNEQIQTVVNNREAPKPGVVVAVKSSVMAPQQRKSDIIDEVVAKEAQPVAKVAPVEGQQQQQVLQQRNTELQKEIKPIVDEPKIVNKQTDEQKVIAKVVDDHKKEDAVIKIDHKLDSGLSHKTEVKQELPQPSVLSMDSIAIKPEEQPAIKSQSSAPVVPAAAAAAPETVVVHRSDNNDDNKVIEIANKKDIIKPAVVSSEIKPIVSAIEAKKHINEPEKDDKKIVDNIKKDDTNNNKKIVTTLEEKVDEPVKKVVVSAPAAVVESKVAEPVIQLTDSDLKKTVIQTTTTNIEETKNIVNIDHIAEDGVVANSGGKVVAVEHQVSGNVAIDATKPIGAAVIASPTQPQQQ
ncbi:uncharacterized protein LOC128959191 [Oppia nitens]|uniref:uncharacterized protein LOC128959191 n=1 Tax=Oppia nitens TaxID=1686743 RepID=UPI0023DC39C5|nr:uncharacterized protein LOC128959191 [Oppia nitens]